MLSEHEQRLWDEIERNYRAEPDEASRDVRTWPGAGRSGRRADLPAPIVGGAWGTVLLVLFGVPSAGVAVGAATGLIWLLWRFFPQLNGETAEAERTTRDVDHRTDAADQYAALSCLQPCGDLRRGSDERD